MRILVSIPCYLGESHTDKAIQSVINSDLLLIDNGSEPAVKEVIKKYERTQHHKVAVIRNPENIFVNAAWQQAIDFFLHSNYDYLCLMNSDLILHSNYKQLLKHRWGRNPDEIILPIIQDKIDFPCSPFIADAQEVHSGTPGVFITLNRKQAEIISPLPDYVKIWHGDEFIYKVLRILGYKTVIPSNFFASHYHGGSQNVQRVKGISALIEEDKRQWELYGEKNIQEVVKKNQGL